MINPHETLGQLATTHPEATRVFLRHQLDFCCGGWRKLVDACHAAGLDPEGVIAEIVSEGALDAPECWDTRPLGDLIDFIRIRYHEPLRSALPALITAAHKVERVHAGERSCPHGLAALLARFHAEACEHLGKEERVLFPAIKAGTTGARVQMPIAIMVQEHDDHANSLRQLRDLTGEYRVPAEACGTWRALYDALDRLDAELRQHIHLENNVLFPRALGE